MAALPYVAPIIMAEYKQQILLFAKGSPSLECVRSHYIPEADGICGLTGRKEQDELFVLANRAGATIKVSPSSMQIIANIVEIVGADQWFEHLREQRKAYRQRLRDDAKRLAAGREAASKVVVRRRSPSATVKDNHTT